MSKIFDELERLESASKQIPGVRPGVAAVAAAAQSGAGSLTAVKPSTIGREEPDYGTKLAQFPRPLFAPAAAPARKNPLQAIAFDASMILLAIAIFAGICVALGSADVLNFARNPWLAIVPLSLAALYLVLARILRGGTPRADGARGQIAEVGATPIGRRAGLGTLGTLMAPVGSSRPVSRRPLLEDLALATRILSAEGVLDAMGSLSVRDDNNANRIYMAGNEISEYDLNGNRTNGDLSEVHPDRFLHCEIYRARPDVMAIVHSQAPELIPFAASSVPMLPVLELADFLVGGVPVFESRRVGAVGDPVMRSRVIGEAIAQNLGDKAAVLVRGRGAIVVGPSLHTTVGRAYYTNMNARLQAQSILLGGSVNYLEPSDSVTSTTAEFERAWAYWKQKAAL